jgi:serine protease Do
MIRLVAVLLLSLAVARAADTSPALDLARKLNNAFIEVAEKVSPSVVVIKVAQKESAGPDLDENNPFWDLVPKEYRRQWEEEREKRKEQKEEATPRSPRRRGFNGQGSGIIVRDDGYILTNFHVVDDAEEIQVRLKDGRRLRAEIRGVDPQSDLAVIKVMATNLPAAKLGDSANVRVGEFAVAIGAPFDLDYSVTYGHVSAKGRSHVIPAWGMNAQGASMDQDFIQTDASINPGNSGGPLVNLYGEVIGINTLIRGLHTGIGFAVPINLAREVAFHLIDDGKFTRSWLGVGIRGLREDEDYKETIQSVEDGVLVTEIRPNGPASKSELRPGDIITRVDGRAVATATQLRNEIRTKPTTNNVILDIVRHDEKQRPKNLKIKVRPEPWPEPKTEIVSKKPGKTPTTGEPPEIGVKVQAVTPALATRWRLAETNGVLITEVESNGLAAPKLRAGDLVTSINHKPVRTVKDFNDAIRKADLDKGVLIDVINRSTKRFEVIRRRQE